MAEVQFIVDGFLPQGVDPMFYRTLAFLPLKGDAVQAGHLGFIVKGVIHNLDTLTVTVVIVRA